MSFFSEDLSLDPRFFELQEELRSVLFAGLSSLSPSRPSTPEDETAETLNFSHNWITECAPHLDKFDENQHFQIQVPLMARKSPALLYAMLAFSSRQMERRGLTQKGCDSLELYQESIRLLTPGLQAKDPNMLVTACILAVFELMSGGARNWRRHVEGCASLFEYFGVNGFSGGLPQAVFWCYARMELCGAIISDGAETTVLPLDQWVPAMREGPSTPEASERFIQSLFHQKSRTSPDTHANWAIYLCTKVCHLRFRRTQYLELGRADWQDSRPFAEQWQRLWSELQFWLDERPPSMKPIRVVEASEKQVFPLIMFPHWAAISSNQVYHAACILMLEMQPPEQNLDSHCLALWHARSVVGISCANPHPGSMVNSIQPLFVAGRLFSHRRLKRILPLLLTCFLSIMSSKPIISVLGSLNIDLVSYVPHHPLPGETITASQFDVFPGGKGANQAVACAKLSRSSDLKEPSVDVAMIGAVGADAYGSVLLESLRSYGVETSAIKVDAESKTGIAMIVVDEPSGQNRIILSPGANASLKPSQFTSLPDPAPTLLIMQLEIPIETVLQALEAAKKTGTPVLLNPAPAQKLPETAYQGLAHLVLNETEAALLSDVKESDLEDSKVVEQVAGQFLARGVKNVVVTLGGRGAYYANETDKAFVPALKVDVVDTTAAGDTFIGMYAIHAVHAMTRSERFDIGEAVGQSIRASSKTVSKKGAQVSIPWKDEL
ncbi:hypothetical protein NCS52_00908100 [Fusarium sp. LHS14.1]|nr:hypothetical protein NCS52_00908100 [Fusarium sp. LHS14.1]